MHPYLTEVYLRQQRQQLASTAERRRHAVEGRSCRPVRRLLIGRGWRIRPWTNPVLADVRWT